MSMGNLRYLYTILFVSFMIYGSPLLLSQGNLHPQSTIYEWPVEDAVKAKLNEWQDQKFGILIHWGLYSEAGIMESWNLCSEDWIERDSSIAYEEYKKWYWGLKKDFNPIQFNPEEWAKAARQAGMRYIVFTAKHHDGFCMFDTKETDFSIAKGPFRNNQKSDVIKYVFEAFRREEFMIGAYFSKPDWHSQYYWWPKYATPDRNNNYDTRKYPWRWNEFKQFTYNQVRELMHRYGGIDILWLDGGWVRPPETVNEEVRSWGARIPEWSQDIDIPRIAEMARKAQPGILIVDRTVHGTYENYQTPEQHIPSKKLDYPWESCLTLANNWGYVPKDSYKSSRQIIHTLIEVVAKGGNLLLGIGPKSDGALPKEALQRLEEIGQWMNRNGESIYNTRTVEHFQDGSTYFTQNKKLGLYFALFCIPGDQLIPTFIEWKGNKPKKGTDVILLQTREKVRWLEEGNSIKVIIPASLKSQGLPVLAFSFHPAENPGSE